MRSQDFISVNIPSLSISDTADKALGLMEDYHVTQLPLVQENHYLGLIKEDELLDWEDTFETFASVNKTYFSPVVFAETHVYEAAKIMQEQQLHILPVINDKQEYIGAITQENIFQYLAKGTQGAENGGTIVLEITQHNYSLSQIARIFESENVSVLSTQIHSNPETNLMQLTIKTNKQDLRAIIATLERLNYIVSEVYAETIDNEDLQNNYSSLMNYLNM
jgi:acetoin utilization protein AcuB